MGFQPPKQVPKKKGKKKGQKKMSKLKRFIVAPTNMRNDCPTHQKNQKTKNQQTNKQP